MKKLAKRSLCLTSALLIIIILGSSWPLVNFARQLSWLIYGGIASEQIYPNCVIFMLSSIDTLGPAYTEFGYNDHPAKTSIFLCTILIDSNVKKFGYNEHPPATSSSFCTFLLVSGTLCNCFVDISLVLYILLQCFVCGNICLFGDFFNKVLFSHLITCFAFILKQLYCKTFFIVFPKMQINCFETC